MTARRPSVASIGNGVKGTAFLHSLPSLRNRERHQKKCARDAAALLRSFGTPRRAAAGCAPMHMWRLVAKRSAAAPNEYWLWYWPAYLILPCVIGSLAAVVATLVPYPLSAAREVRRVRGPTDRRHLLRASVRHIILHYITLHRPPPSLSQTHYITLHYVTDLLRASVRLRCPPLPPRAPPRAVTVARCARAPTSRRARRARRSRRSSGWCTRTTRWGSRASSRCSRESWVGRHGLVVMIVVAGRSVRAPDRVRAIFNRSVHPVRRGARAERAERAERAGGRADDGGALVTIVTIVVPNHVWHCQAGAREPGRDEQHYITLHSIT